MNVLKRTRESHGVYSEVAFFETTTEDSHFAAYDARDRGSPGPET